MTITQTDHDRLQRRGIRLEWATTGWNLMEVFVTIGLGLAAKWLSAFQGWIVGRRVQSGRPA
jgi:hypothetical protein